MVFVENPGYRVEAWGRAAAPTVCDDDSEGICMRGLGASPVRQAPQGVLAASPTEPPPTRSVRERSPIQAGLWYAGTARPQWSPPSPTTMQGPGTGEAEGGAAGIAEPPAAGIPAPGPSTFQGLPGISPFPGGTGKGSPSAPAGTAGGAPEVGWSLPPYRGAFHRPPQESPFLWARAGGCPRRWGRGPLRLPLPGGRPLGEGVFRQGDLPVAPSHTPHVELGGRGAHTWGKLWAPCVRLPCRKPADQQLAKQYFGFGINT